MTQSPTKTAAKLWQITATLLLALLCGVMIAPGLSSDEGLEGSVPACCRTHGKHQCSLKLRPQAAPENETSFAQLTERCPYTPASLAPAHSIALHPATSSLTFSTMPAHPTSRRQTEARGRIAFDRSRQKRGPPTTLISA